MIIKDINNQGLKEVLCVVQAEADDYSAEKIVIPDGVDIIGWDAFCNFQNLKEVIMPDSVKEIRGGAFEKCINLEKVTLSKNITDIDGDAFKCCHSLKDINIKDITAPKLSIGGEAFAYCHNLTEVVFPDIYTSIGSAAFFDCRSLSKVEIPRVGYIGENAFTNDRNLKRIVLGKKRDKQETSKYFSGLLCLGNGAFSYSGIENLDLSNLAFPINEIPAQLCEDCQSLKTVTLPGEGIEFIGSSAFRRCMSLVDINIPNSTTDICRCAFADCKSLKSITIPAEVEQIGDKAFFRCDELTIVTINSASVKFGEKVFRNCDSLKSVVIPSNVRFDSSIFDEYTSVTISMMYDR